MSSSSKEKVLSVRELKKVYKGKPPCTAVDAISFDLSQGEILGLLGPNGSGKTTTIQMLLGTLASSSGTITYFGKNFAEHRSEILRHVSFASTYTSLPWSLTLQENLEVFGCFYGLTRKESAKRFDPLLERFGIYAKKKQRVASLSAGQITRVMLVKAFFVNPKIVLLDEPTASLDPDVAKDICAFLLEQRKQTGLSLLFCSHRMDEVMQVCDRAIFLKGGKIIADDLPAKLARSVSAFRVRLGIVDGLKRTLAIIQTMGISYQQDQRNLEVVLDEEKIPPFLKALTQADVAYSSIKIEEPSLEEFFLQIAKKNS
ncbi:MAG: ABC transporter ATP-binding protein [Chlamydiales bacterium]